MTKFLQSLEDVRLSTTYRIVAGDTFDKISRKLYGYESEASRIASANPGLAEPLTPGTSIVIPPIPGALRDAPQKTASGDPDETILTIGTTRFRFWTEIVITRQSDKFSTVAFSAPFDSGDLKQRELFRPMSFKDMGVTIGGEQVVTGTLVDPVPRASPTAKTVEVSGYGRPGVLNDCTLPFSAYPKEFFKQDLNQIAQAMVEPFGLPVVFQGPPGAVFESVRAAPGDFVLAFLEKLSGQRQIVMSDTPLGELLFRQSVKEGSPVAAIVQGEPPLISIFPTFKPQQHYSHVTGIQPALAGIKGITFTVKNPRLLNVVRPFTFELPDIENAEVEAAVRSKAGRMFSSSVSYEMELDTWRDDKGELWKPDTTITVLAPGAAVYRQYEFEIRQVQLRRTPSEKTALLELIIPGAYSGILPEVLPWDD